jgi:hypothetical protein
MFLVSSLVAHLVFDEMSIWYKVFYFSCKSETKRLGKCLLQRSFQFHRTFWQDAIIACLG